MTLGHTTVSSLVRTEEKNLMLQLVDCLVIDFIFSSSKITLDGDCSHDITRRLLLGRKTMTNLESILISRNITLPTKVCIVKPMVFSVVMYRCERWTMKKVEC